MRNVFSCLLLAGLAVTAVPASAQVRVYVEDPPWFGGPEVVEERVVVRRPRVVEERVVERPRRIVKERIVVRPSALECRVVEQQRVRRDGTTVVRKIRRCV